MASAARSAAAARRTGTSSAGSDILRRAMTDWLQWVVRGARVLSRAGALLGGAREPAPPAPGKSRGRRHSRPREDSPVPVRGWPHYLAGLTIGGPVSDFGS